MLDVVHFDERVHFSMHQSHNIRRMNVCALVADTISSGTFKSGEAVVLKICLMPLRNDLICFLPYSFAFHISGGCTSLIHQCTMETT